MRRVVITGVGAVTPLGNDAASTWQGLVEGRSGVGPITTFDPTGFPVRIAGEVRGFGPEALPDGFAGETLSRAGQFVVAAAAEALRSAGTLDPAHPEDERGVSLGACCGHPDLQLMMDVGAEREATGRPDAFVRRTPDAVLCEDQNVPVNAVARLLGGYGPAFGVSTACSASGHAIGEALRSIQEGDATFMLAGGFDALTTWIDVIGFNNLGALTRDYNDDPQSGSRPFAAHRSGFVLGEGAVVLALEERTAALERGAEILAELRGYASTLNAWRVTDSPPDGSGADLVMQRAIADAGLTTDAIDYVVAHGTGTPGNDRSETNAIKTVFGDGAHRLVISSPKSMAGHLTSASAALGALTAVGAIRHSVVPPTINLDTPDRKLDLDYVPKAARRMPVRTAVVNAFAFGGSNSCLVIGAHEEDPDAIPSSPPTTTSTTTSTKEKHA
ncbi:beta-ketoacyl-[acyl-carrier-protein] synthase family protein [Streptomyces sp. NPDC041068]|uniref:beta-ketoacyl-[acyl-carrier-protein] synthase family protein n=1 Tax=Streptomyces sp. NPDC041068 TaxID=3155130 RepID=UPI0033C681D9